MTPNQWLQQMAHAEPAEPRGWFRWLHNHYMGRFGCHHPNLVFGNAFSGWEQLAGNLDELVDEIDPELLVAVINRHPWAWGMKKQSKSAASVWNRLAPLTRGAFMAGLSEVDFSEKLFIKLISRQNEPAEFSPESLCQLACNAVKAKALELLQLLFLTYPSPTQEIRRFSASGERWDNWETKELEKLSHRVIDMILEAALINDDVAAARLALEHGADPAMPIWQLERSSNHTYSPLGYVIDSDYRRNVNPYSEMAELLLAYGAPARGIPYAGYNHELFLSLQKGWREFAERLLEQGAGFSTTGSDDGRVVTKTAGSESEVIGPGGPNFFGHFRDRLTWAHRSIGSIIPLVPVGEKKAFFTANAQGGSWSTLMDRVIADIDCLKRYESLGLDTRLSAEELCTAISAGAFDSLVYLLSKHGDEARDRAMFRIRRRKPDIGAAWRHLETVPQADGINIATGFDPEGLEPFALPDGSRLYADLSAIAPPGHGLGPCAAGHFWLREDTLILRRRKDKVIVHRLEKKWRMEPLPLGPPGTCRDQRYLDACLPCIREMEGQFIHLGLTLHGIIWRLPDCELKKSSSPWQDLPPYVSLLDKAEQRISEQVAGNSLPTKPVLSAGELRGYPPEYWSYLVRLPNGFIGMTAESCHGNVGLLKEYRAWARKAKIRERTFVPDPRLLAWEHWGEVPDEYKPYYYWDTMLGNRPRVTMGDYDNKYDKEMAGKVRNWHEWKWTKWHRAKMRCESTV